jgi:hypothetical protein
MTAQDERFVELEDIQNGQKETGNDQNTSRDLQPSRASLEKL